MKLVRYHVRDREKAASMRRLATVNNPQVYLILYPNIGVLALSKAGSRGKAASFIA